MMQLVATIQDLPDFNNINKNKSSYTPNINKNEDFQALRQTVRTKAMKTYGLGEEVEQLASFPETYSFDRFSINDPDLISKLEKELNIRKSVSRIQMLMPGQLTLEHLDDLDSGYMNPIEEELCIHEFTDEEKQNFKNDPYYVKRFLIMLEDWKPGQGIMFGKEVFAGWKKGDTITWDWVNDVHSTFNTGFWARPLIRITGLRCD